MCIHCMHNLHMSKLMEPQIKNVLLKLRKTPGVHCEKIFETLGKLSMHTAGKFPLPQKNSQVVESASKFGRP